MIRSFLVALVVSTLAVGCTVTAAPAAPGDDIAYEAPPPNVETYPSYVYEGTPHYYVNGRWYTHTARGWGYRKTEPPALAQHRPPPPRPEEPREERH